MAEPNIDSELLQDAPQTLFTTDNGQPLLFHIPVTETDRDELSQLIFQHGGSLTDDATLAQQGQQGQQQQGKGDDEIPRVIIISKYAEVHHDTYDPRLVFDSVYGKKLAQLEHYKNVVSGNETAGDVQQLVSYLHENQDNQDNQAQKAGSNGASNEDVIGGGETENAADSRVLSAIAEARNATADDDNTIKRRAPSSVTAKNGFSPEEDEIILEQVRQNPQRRSSHKLFYEIAKLIGRHTGNSIRYRFRNHLTSQLTYVYKTDPLGNLVTDSEGKYIPVEDFPHTLKRKFTAKEDYNLAKAVRKELLDKDGSDYRRNPTDVTLSGKFFEGLADDYPEHTKSAWRDRYRKFIIPYGIDNYIEYYENEISESRVPEEIKNFTGKHLYKSKKNINNIEDEIGSKLTEHNNQFEEDQHQRKKRKTPGNYSKTHTTDAEGNVTANDSTNVFIAGDQDDLHDLDQSNYYNPHTAVAVAQATKSNSASSENASAPDPEEFLTSDLVTSKFFTFQPLITAVDKITEIVNRSYDSTDAENLIHALYSEAGIQKKFGTFIITSVCGDLILIPKYIEIFLQTGENPPKDTHGIWTSRDDEYLRSGDEEKLKALKALHGNRRIELRRQFISQELI
jgi:Myb-like DNA-binding protein RAP1